MASPLIAPEARATFRSSRQKTVRVGLRGTALRHVGRTLAISCEAAIWTGFVSFIALFDRGSWTSSRRDAC
jgi:hypothetical protein